MKLENEIRQKAAELGFDLVGISTARPLELRDITIFQNWLNKGFAAKMEFLHSNPGKRFNPASLLDGAKSVIVTALNYKTRPLIRDFSSRKPSGRVASFAQYEDYHPFIKKNLQKLADFLKVAAGQNHKFKICVDSAPLAEKALAVRAGIGFIGKNHLLINPKFGPQLLLGEIITTIGLEYDKPLKADCEDCDKCIKACPAGALHTDCLLDANKCVSYLTIEHKNEIPPDLAEKIGDHLFGCDACILACPYQKNAPRCSNRNFRFFLDLRFLDLYEILKLDKKGFDEKFAASPIKRIGLERLQRNAKICLEYIISKRLV
jgi:epoxyqueuosine reductase